MNLIRKQCLIFALIAICASFGISAESARTESAGPKAVIEQIFEKAKSEKLADDVKLQGEISNHINFDKMAGEVLKGQSIKVATQESAWFSNTLGELIQLTVYPEASSFLSGVKISYVDEMKEGTKASVTSELEKKGEITEVKYTLLKNGTSWEVIDVAIDDESWVESIREEVKGVIAESQWEGLKKKMNSRLNELRAKKSSAKKS